MADHKPSAGRSEARQKKSAADQAAAEQKLAGLLDDPAQPDQASPLRSAIYFALILLVALALNFALMVAISGGQ